MKKLSLIMFTPLIITYTIAENPETLDMNPSTQSQPLESAPVTSEETSKLREHQEEAVEQDSDKTKTQATQRVSSDDLPHSPSHIESTIEAMKKDAHEAEKKAQEWMNPVDTIFNPIY